MSERRDQQRLAGMLRSVWRRDQTSSQAAGLLTLCGYVLLLFLVVLALDRLLDLPRAGRFVALGGIVAFSVRGAWRTGWRHSRRFDAAHTALRVESSHGGLESLLVTAVQFAEPEGAHGASRAMREHTLRAAEEAAVPLRADEVVSYAGLRRLALLACIPAVIMAAVAVVNGPVLVAGLARVFTPWVDVVYPTRTRIELDGAKRIVKAGEGLRLVATVTGEIPEDATIELRTGGGNPRQRRLGIVDGICAYEVETVFRGFDYRFSAGDARSPWSTVEVVSSPRVESAVVQLEFPGYTARATETVDALTLTAPEGTRLQWTLSLDRPVDQAEYRPAEGEARSLQVSADGRTVMMEQVAAESRAYQFGWVGRAYGFAFTSPRYYLQVEPDRAPSVSLASPAGNLIATLERPIELEAWGRDDHGIAEAAVVYRVNKTEEKTAAFEVKGLASEGKQKIDWNYKQALPDLTVGDTISVSIEVADAYPGDGGPHRVRSEARRVRFVSKEDYLAHVEKQKRRLLTRVRTLYREERAVYELVLGLDPSSEVFLQTCQLEAVRQDLIRDRLGAIGARIEVLVDDAAANGVSEEAATAALVELGRELKRVGDREVRGAASLLRDLASVEEGGGRLRDPAPAIDGVDRAARELALLVLQLGFHEASDVMARELHGTAQAQAALRARTLMESGEADGTALAQARLADACARLLAATPRNRESTSQDALVAFKLSRLVDGLLREGTEVKMREAAARVKQGEQQAAARRQADVIAALLRAEFRLRRGAEYEALIRARDLFVEQVTDQESLRTEIEELSEQEFGERRGTVVAVQSTLLRRLRLLLMPAVPARRVRLFEAVAPTAPPVDDLLLSAERSLEGALARLAAGERGAAIDHQRRVADDFAELADITERRMESLQQVDRMRAAVATMVKHGARVVMLEERLVTLLEQAEDAAADEVSTASLATVNQSLADDVRTLREGIRHWSESQDSGSDAVLPLLDRLTRVADGLGGATPLLADNQPKKAIERQEGALELLEEATVLLEQRGEAGAAFASVLGTTAYALAPSPLLLEIEGEQQALAARTEKAKPEERKALVIPQKNLVHAVDAVLTSLDPLSHKIESGTVMVFAKDDMDAAAIGLETDDIEEALDAQSFVVESIQKLRAKIDAVTPQYRYVLEVIEFLHESVGDADLARAGAGRLTAPNVTSSDVEALRERLERSGRELARVTGEDRYGIGSRQVLAAIASENPGDALPAALETLSDNLSELRTMMKNLAYLVAPPPSSSMTVEPSAEIKLLHQVLDVAAHHHDLLRIAAGADSEQLGGLAERQRALADRCGAFVRAGEVAATHPKLIAAHGHLLAAATKLADQAAAAMDEQRKAADALRAFILEFTLKFVDVPPPAPPQPPAPDGDPPVDGELQLFLPGALTGTKPKGGRQEWQVLGARDRAALNENFARELPLEYRAILKDYYERLTR